MDEDWTPGGGRTSIWTSRPPAGGGLDDEESDDEDSIHSHTPEEREGGAGGRVGGAGQVASRGLALGTEDRGDGNDDGDPERRRPWRSRWEEGRCGWRTSREGTVCRLVTPCAWGFQEIVLGGSPAAELRGIEAEGVSERDDRDPR